jgi:hypothetical protein
VQRFRCQRSPGTTTGTVLDLSGKTMCGVRVLFSAAIPHEHDQGCGQVLLAEMLPLAWKRAAITGGSR